MSEMHDLLSLDETKVVLVSSLVVAIPWTFPCNVPRKAPERLVVYAVGLLAWSLAGLSGVVTKQECVERRGQTASQARVIRMLSRGLEKSFPVVRRCVTRMEEDELF